MASNSDLSIREFVLMYYFEIKNDFLTNEEKYSSALNEYLKTKRSKLNNRENLRLMFLNSKDAYAVILELQKNGY
jgi:hypothetical protein